MARRARFLPRLFGWPLPPARGGRKVPAAAGRAVAELAARIAAARGIC